MSTFQLIVAFVANVVVLAYCHKEGRKDKRLGFSIALSTFALFCIGCVAGIRLATSA